MQLVEQHIINRSNQSFLKIDTLAFLSKNLYNAALYEVKQEFRKSGKWLRYLDLENIFRKTNNVDFFALPTNTSQQILQVLDRNLKSYFALLKKFKKDKTSLSGCPKFPHYKDKLKGRNVIVFTENQARLHLDKGIIKFPKRTGIESLKTRVDNLCQVRIVPRSSCYMIEVVYNKSEIVKERLTDNWLSIDPGLNNLMTCYDSKNDAGIIISGKPIKSINQYYNKKLAKLASQLEKRNGRKTSRRLSSMTNKRNNKIKDYLHKSSRLVVDYCVKNKIDNVVIGKNENWKTSVNMGRKTNQSFVQIPHARLISMIEYKSRLVGIEVHLTEESYTSKCSALDLETLEKHDEYKGKRIKRGLYKSDSGIFINADLNGAMNILRKVTGDKVLDKSWAQTQSSRGQVRWPVNVGRSSQRVII